MDLLGFCDLSFTWTLWGLFVAEMVSFVINLLLIFKISTLNNVWIEIVHYALPFKVLAVWNYSEIVLIGSIQLRITSTENNYVSLGLLINIPTMKCMLLSCIIPL